MSDKKKEELYWSLVENFIEKANESLESDGRLEGSDNLGAADFGLVCNAMMEATSRFSAFYVANSSEDRKALKEDKDDAVKDFSAEFKARFASNLEDYIENYKVLIAKGRQESQ